LAVETDMSTELNQPPVEGVSREYDMAADGLHTTFSTSATNIIQSTGPGSTYVEDTSCTVLLSNVICSPQINVESTEAGTPVLSGHALLMVVSRFAQVTPFRTSIQAFVQGTCIKGIDRQACLDGGGGAGVPAVVNVSVDNSGRPGTGDVSSYSISGNGEFVVFTSPDSLAPHSGQFPIGMDNIFVRDTCQVDGGQAVQKVCGNPSTTTISVANDLMPANDLDFISSHAVSADGRLVIFSSRATNLAQGGPSGNGEQGVFIRDTCRDAPPSCNPSTVLVSVDSTGAFVRGGANGDSDAVISADGHYCAFSVDLPINGTVTKQFVLALTGF
jgi:hypothetical protein